MFCDGAKGSLARLFLVLKGGKAYTLSPTTLS